LAVLVAAPMLLAGCAGSGSGPAHPSDLNDQTGSSGIQGAGLDPAQPRPSFTLTDSSGKSLAFGEVTRGHPTLLYFGYTNCPDVCPTTMYDVGAALRSLPASLQQSVDVVFVSTDVKRDTGAVIARWLSNFSTGTKATWLGLRGTQAQIDAAQAAARIPLAEDNGETHSAQVLFYGPDDYAREVFLQSTSQQQQIAHDVPLVARGAGTSG
jgi:protein SCO1/2